MDAMIRTKYTSGRMENVAKEIDRVHGRTVCIIKHHAGEVEEHGTIPWVEAMYEYEDGKNDLEN